MHVSTDHFLTAVLAREFPSLTSAPMLLRSMNAQPSFKQGNPSQNVTTLLERIQSADPTSPDIDEDNKGQSWGHYQFTAGGLTLSYSLTTWQDIGSIATAFKLVAAALKTCREARLTCKDAGVSTTVGFISDVYLEKTLESLESCWVGAGGVSSSILWDYHTFTFTFSRRSPLLMPHAFLPHPRIATLQSHLRMGSRSSYPLLDYYSFSFPLFVSSFVLLSRSRPTMTHSDDSG